MVVQVPQEVWPGAGPVITKPWDVPGATMVLPLTTAESTTLKLAFLTIKVALPVLMVMVGPLSVARLEPPKLPPPLVALVKAMPVFCPPAATSAKVSTNTHLAFPEGQRPRILNWPDEAPDRPNWDSAVMFSESERGMPTETGSWERAMPDTPG